MGNQLNCLAQCQARQEASQRLLLLQKGAYFMRKKTLLGLSTGSEKIHVKLAGDEQTLLWKPHESTKSANKVDLQAVNTVQTQGTHGFSLVSRKGDTLLEVEADSEDIRDNWVTNLQLLCEDNGAMEETSEEEVAASSRFKKMMADRAKKQAYWAKRTQELEERKQAAEERKQKFAGAGMKYTALAMSNRPAPSASD